MIPVSAKVKWENLGCELNIEYARLQAIKQNVTPGDVVVKCQAMLQKWTEQSREPDKLIKALKDCQLNAYAKVVEDGQFIVCINYHE